MTSHLSDSEGGVLPAITPSSSIPEIINVIKHSFRDCEFNEVQNMLIDREKKMKIEIDDLKVDLDYTKNEASLIERAHNLAELEKLKLEEELQTSQRKCEELNEAITRLTEEERVSSDRAKRAEERYEKVSQVNSKMTSEKNKLIRDLKDEMCKSKNINLENEGLVRAYEDKLKLLERKAVEMGEKIEDLKREKLGDDQTMDELRRRQDEADRVVEELKRENVELRAKNAESEEAVRVNKSRLEKLAARVMNAEATLASILNVKVEDFGMIIETMEKSGGKGGNVGILDDFKCGKDGKCSAEDVAVSSRGGIGLLEKSGRNLVNSRSKEEGVNTVGASPGSRSGCKRFRVEIIDNDLQDGGEETLASGSEARHYIKTGCSSSAVEEVIVICDSDDETKPGKTSDASSGQTNKRNSRDCKRKRFFSEFDYEEEKKRLEKRRA